MSGKIYLVGAGPGDPGLLTMRGAQALARAQAVVYDFLANPELLELAPADARRIYVGKKGADHTMEQEDINQLLVDLGLEGLTVARLKGGDPFVFGRGGEEASALAEAGVDFEVVPGVTSAIAAPAYAGIPVTDRRAATEVALVTGHEDPSKTESTINWPSLAGMGSLVFLMGVKNLPNICAKLMEHGKSPNTPAACVRWGTTPRQETVSGTLADLPDKVKAHGLKPPAITIVGGVAGLRQELAWFERQRPLLGKRVLVTRARAQASKLSAGLRELGAAVVEIPTIEIRPPADPGPLRDAARDAGEYQWVVFTSPNGVAAFFAALDEAHGDARRLAGAKVAAIGPATAQALAENGIKADVMAKTFVAEGLLESLAGHDLSRARVLLPRAAQAREVLPQTLASRGAMVEVVAAYETVPPAGAAELLASALDQGLDAVTFTASSTVANLMKLVDEEQRQKMIADSAAGTLTVASIGPITSDTARDAGLTVAVEPQQYTIPALIAALAGHFGG